VLFRWVQGAAFYEDVHAAAVALLQRGEGLSWLDVGTGPGLVARLAARRGYDALGIDRDPAMIRAARALAPAVTSPARCRFEVADLAAVEASCAAADVVSAASLLIVVPEPQGALAQLWGRVRPGGALLVVETTPEMTPARAAEIAPRTRRGRRAVLAVWARARSGRAIAADLVPGFAPPDLATRERHPLLEGLVEAWVLRKAR
jgi:ubiquinone/menaquinone biosynthesis C-methylase UbiE